MVSAATPALASDSPSLRRRLFAALYDRLTASSEPPLTPLRERTAGQARGDVLELGAGTGANLPYYAADVKLTAFERNAAMASRLSKRATSLGRSIQVNVARGGRLPYPDGSFDAVVVSFVLCSVTDVASILSEVRRVLRPGGTFWFLEHVASADPGVRRWQRRLNPIQRFFADGCELDRDTAAAIRTASFSSVHIEEAQHEGAQALTRRLIVGSAVV